MSQAFVKESEEQWLHEIQPTLTVLTVYLTGENNGIRVYEKSTRVDPKTNKMIHEMSNGMGYTHNEEGNWTIVL